jgi:hypothetical protein
MNKHEQTLLIRKSLAGIDRTKYPGARGVVETRIRRMANLYNITIQGFVADLKLNGSDSLTASDRTDIARQIGTSLYDITPIWSGYHSEAALQNINNRKNEVATMKAAGKKCPKSSVAMWTPEHFYPRQVAGDWLVNYICTHGNITFDTFASMLHDFITVHRVTAEENTRLRPFQKTDTFIRWEDGYQAVGIVLIHDKTGDVYKYS